MKAVQVVGYHTKLQLTDIPEPTIEGPLDVIVKIGGAGVCRTDIHILEGQWEQKSGVKLPYTIGHENAGWVHAVGDAVTNVTVGDKVILHPLITCGLCRACRSGDDVHCEKSSFPGIDTNGGYAEYLRTTARSVVKIDDALEPADVAALADAGLTAYHAAAKVARATNPGQVCVVVGAGDAVDEDVHLAVVLGEPAGQLLADDDIGVPCDLQSAVDRVVVGQRDEVHAAPLCLGAHFRGAAVALGAADRVEQRFAGLVARVAVAVQVGALRDDRVRRTALRGGPGGRRGFGHIARLLVVVLVVACARLPEPST